VYATNAYTSGLLPQYSANIVPCRGICCHITVPDGKDAPFLPYSYLIRSAEGNGQSYLITRPDGSIIVGGAQYTFEEERKQWYKVIDDSTLIEPAKNYYDDFMQRTFRGWEESGAYVKEIWTGSEYPTLPYQASRKERDMLMVRWWQLWDTPMTHPLTLAKFLISLVDIYARGTMGMVCRLFSLPPKGSQT
jgi:hypothetical protein